MAIPSPAYWYVNYGDGSTTGYYALGKWTALTAYVAGQMIRQLAAPAVGSERVFICIIAGTSLAAEPTWTITKGAKTAEAAGPTWQECTGQAALNGSLTYTSGWTSGPGGVGTGVKNQAVALGYIIARDSGASYQICTTAGTAGNGAEPSFSNTAGTTTSDNTVTWTSLGVVGGFTTAFGAPHPRLLNAYATNWVAAGDTVFIGDNHAETQASTMALRSNNSTAALPVFVYSVDHTKTSPATGDLLAGATITSTGGTNSTDVSGYSYYYGTTFTGTGSNGVAFCSNGVTTFTGEVVADTCKIITSGNLAMGPFQGSAFCKATFINTTVKFSATSQSINLRGGCTFVWRNTATAIDAAGSAPTSLFTFASSNSIGGTSILLDGVDLVFLGAGKTIFNLAGLPNGVAFITARFCKLGASVVTSTTPLSGAAGVTDIIDCDSGATSYRQERWSYFGTLTQETTIVRTGGATDGTTSLSWKIVTTANSRWVMPFESIPIQVPWNGTTGSSMTVTVYGIWGGGAVPLNDDIWIEVEYPGSSATPQASFANTTKANNLAVGANTTTDASTWGGSTTAFKMVATFTPQMAGPIFVTVKAAKISSTFYIDPQADISTTTTAAKRDFIVPGPLYINQTAGSGGLAARVVGGLLAA